MSSKIRRVRVIEANVYKLEKACVECNRGINYSINIRDWAGSSRAMLCTCGAELWVKISADGASALVSLPRGCDEWRKVSSSNLAAVGRKGEDLIIRFLKGTSYIYPGAGELFDDLLAAESAGKFFHARIRSRPSKRLPALD
jgi:hypothetical protein